MELLMANARLEARISAELHALLKRAAELEGRTLTDYVVSAVQAAAQQTVQQATAVALSLEAQEVFARALLSPPAATQAMKRAFARRKKLLRED